MKLQINFFHDWIIILEELLIEEWDCDLSDISFYQIPYAFYNIENKRINNRSRAVHLSKEFICTPQDKKAWNKLKEAIKIGGNLIPYLSKGISKPNYNDSMLNDWGIYHFHLGSEVTDQGFIKRTGQLLYAYVTKDDFYAINIYDHKSWCKEEIINIIHKNWPDLLEKYKINNHTTFRNVTEKQKGVLRSKNCNSLIKVIDGTVYLPIGGGTVSSGNNIKHIIKTDKQKKYLESLENDIKNNIGKFEDVLIERGYKYDETINIELRVENKVFYAFLPDYKIKINFQDTN